MPELRKDPIVDRWVIVAPDRALRPNEFSATDRQSPRARATCEFCEGNEAATPGELLALRWAGTAADQPGWRVRVVPNKYPALDIDAQANGLSAGLHEWTPGIGRHEVIIESPRHLIGAAEQSAENIGEVFEVYRQRMLAIKQDQRLVYGLVFKNVGSLAGASLEHVHSQLVGLPIVPVQVADELARSRELMAASGRCIFCDLVDRERAAGVRMVLDTPEFVAFCPFAARTPFETWLLPVRHESHFENISGALVAQLAQTLKRVLDRIEARLDRLAYNYLIHTAPFDTPALGHYHWHIEIIPRVTTIAGFEWGSGFNINPLPPEDAAALLADAS